MLLWDGGGADNEIKKGMPTNLDDPDGREEEAQADERSCAILTAIYFKIAKSLRRPTTTMYCTSRVG